MVTIIAILTVWLAVGVFCFGATQAAASADEFARIAYDQRWLTFVYSFLLAFLPGPLGLIPVCVFGWRWRHGLQFLPTPKSVQDMATAEYLQAFQNSKPHRSL